MAWLAHFNPYHDENGRFTSSGHAKSGGNDQKALDTAWKKYRQEKKAQKEKAKAEREASIRELEARKGNIKNMSNEEIKAAMNRLTLEKNYKDALDALTSKETRFIEKLKKTAVDDVLLPAAADVGKQFAKVLFAGAVNKIAGQKIVSANNGGNNGGNKK